MRVLTIDDSPVFLAVLNDLLERYPDVRVVGSATDGHQGLAAATDCQPDLVFVDLNMPGLSGLEVAERLSARQPPPRVVVMSLLDDVDCHQRAAEANAERFVCKNNIFLHLPGILTGGKAAPAC